MDEWETITKGSAHRIERLKTPTGWLILGRITGLFNADISVTFIPDPEHEWVR